MMPLYDDVIMRTIIELPKEQLTHLDAHCRRAGISRAEAIRRAVAAMLDGQAPVDADRAFGLWADRSRELDGLVHALRDEWR